MDIKIRIRTALLVALIACTGLLSGCTSEEEPAGDAADAGETQQDAQSEEDDGSSSGLCDPCPMEREGYVCGPKYLPSSDADANGDGLVCLCTGYCEELTGAACDLDAACVTDNVDGCRDPGPNEPGYTRC